jgi:hypothetical protein
MQNLIFQFYLYRHAKSGNEQFVSELSKWVFHERGHLKVGSQVYYFKFSNDV